MGEAKSHHQHSKVFPGSVVSPLLLLIQLYRVFNLLFSMLGPFCSENVRNNVVFHSSETTLRNYFRLVGYGGGDGGDGGGGDGDGGGGDGGGWW